MQSDKNFSSNKLFNFAGYLKICHSVTLAELHGLVTAAVSSPKLVSSDEWLSPLRLDEFESRTEAQAVLTTLTDMHNKTVTSLESKQYCSWLSYDGVDAFACEVDAAVAWSEGYMAGVALHEDDWLLSSGAEVEKLLAPIIVLAASEEDLRNQGGGICKLSCVDFLPDAAINVYHFWHSQGNKTLRTSIIDNGYTLH